MGKLHTKKIQHKYFEDILENGKKFEIGMEEERREKLRRAIEILQRIYDFKVVDKTDTYNGWYEILTPDLAMTREKLTKEEFEILKNALK